MKLTFKDKKQMIELRKCGWSWPELSKKFQANKGLSPVQFRTKSFA